jgi:anti-sigma factor RsiW
VTPSALVEEADLHALVDGELDPERRRKVEDHLLQHPEDAALVESWRRQNAALRAAFEPVARETPPLSLRDAASRPPAPPQGHAPIETGAIHWGRPSGSARSLRRLDEIRASRRRQTIVSSILTLLAGGAVAGATILVFTGTNAPKPPPAASVAQGFVARAGVTYLTFVSDPRPVEIDAARKGELSAWLGARAGFSRLPDLSGLGLSLVGGRIAPGVATPAGFLLYEKDNGARVGLYFERAEPNAATPQAPRAAPGLAAIEWRAAGMAFVLIGPLGLEMMQAAAERAAAEVLAPQPPAPETRP